MMAPSPTRGEQRLQIARAHPRLELRLSDHLPIIALSHTQVGSVTFPADLRTFVDEERWTFADL